MSCSIINLNVAIMFAVFVPSVFCSPVSFTVFLVPWGKFILSFHGLPGDVVLQHCFQEFIFYFLIAAWYFFFSSMYWFFLFSLSSSLFSFRWYLLLSSFVLFLIILSVRPPRNRLSLCSSVRWIYVFQHFIARWLYCFIQLLYKYACIFDVLFLCSVSSLSL
jgi:hypothetical protein